MYAHDSIELLATSGIQFKKHDEQGIDVETFAELLMTSGVILNDQVKWITFHRYFVCFLFTLFIHISYLLFLSLKLSITQEGKFALMLYQDNRELMGS